jgi:hypothetical protein
MIGLGALAATTVAVRTASAQGGKSSGPTLIKDTENPARSAVHGVCDVTWTNLAGFGQCTLMTVPASKRLVVEHASAFCYTQGADFLTSSAIQTQLAGGSQSTIWTHLVRISQPSEPGANRSVASQPMRAYADPGTPVRGVSDFVGDPSDSLQACQFSFSGHLVDVQ